MICKIIHDLANQALLAKVDIPICAIRWSTLRGIDPQIDMAPFLPNQNLDSVFRNELNLSTINPPFSRMQRTLEIIEIEDQNLHGSQSNLLGEM